MGFGKGHCISVDGCMWEDLPASANDVRNKMGGISIQNRVEAGASIRSRRIQHRGVPS